MKALAEYLLQFGHLNEEQTALITGKAEALDLRKGDYFSKAGSVPRQVGFVAEGVVRGYYHNEEGADITRCFIGENSLVCDYVHFEAGTPSSEHLQACTDCRLLVFSKTGWEQLSQLVEGWDRLKNRMVQQCMYQKSRKGPVISQDATTRYLEFMDNHPTLINRVPLAYVASYLGITQPSLSRIRKNIR